jgi:hypothetical protein
MRSVFSRRRLSSLTTTYQEAINSWNLAKESKISRIAMINAELSQIKGNCELERDLYSRLRTERDALNNELGSTNLDFKFQHKYQTGKGMKTIQLYLIS